MSIEELRQDSEEFGKLLAEATRRRVKDALVAAKAEVDKEILTLEMKAKQAAERKLNNESETKRYVVELTEYAWDQSDKFVKMFVNLDGVQNLAEDNVTVKYTENSMVLLVTNLNNKDYTLRINNLLEPINIDKSYRKIKNGMVAIYMKKEREHQHWETLTTIQKRLKNKQDEEMKKDAGEPGDALVNIMKKMYQSGDTQTKQMIAKTWTECQQKARVGDMTPPSI